MPRLPLVVLCAGALAGLSAGLGAAPAAARPAATGWYAEGSLGAVMFLPSAADDAAIGPAFHLRVGRDLFSWLSVGIDLAASSHEATVPPPPEGEWFQLYRGTGDVRLGGRLDRLALFIEGGAGLAMISSNVLEKVAITGPGENFTIAFQAGAGAEYQLENRHYAFGLGVDAFLLPQFDALRALDARLYLRYTY
ncbi:MAG TPA: outer membrane beta-barrel protein [Kofleriaceae bacterium]|nr:outer membrane beta-barrel protein [Kofleriaceae bacterium]